MSRSKWILAVVACVAGSLVVMPTTSRPAGASTVTPVWSAQAVPGQMSSYIGPVGQAVSCVGPTSSYCVAVGGGNYGVGYIFKAGAWQIDNPTILIPDGDPGGAGEYNTGTQPDLTGVSCITTTYCLAVGEYNVTWYGSGAVAALWSARSGAWLQVQFNSLDGRNAAFNAVSCNGSRAVTGCEVVGEEWTGSEWVPAAWYYSAGVWAQQVVAAPAGAGTFNGVSCAAFNSCVAVGAAGGSPLVEVWNGSTWSVQPSPSEQGGLFGVSCLAGTPCVAVGMTGQGVVLPGNAGLVEVRNGSTWSVVPGTTNEVLDAVSCYAGGCEAVGQGIFGYSGTVLTHQADTATSSTGGILGGISCASEVTCEAVGGGQGNSQPNGLGYYGNTVAHEGWLSVFAEGSS